MSVRMPEVARAVVRSLSRVPRPVWAWALAVLVAVETLVWPGAGQSSPAVLVTWLAASCLLTAAGVLLAGRPGQRRNAALFITLAVVNAADGLDGHDWGPWPLLDYILDPVVILLLAVLLMRWPAEHLHSRAEVWALRYAWASVGVLTVGIVLTWDPAWGGYDGPAWWPVLLPIQPLERALEQAQRVNQLTLLVLFLVLLALRVRRTPPAARRPLLPVIVAALLLAGMAFARSWLRLVTMREDSFTDLLAAVQNLSLVAVPVSVLVYAGVRRVQRALAVEALLRPAALPDPEAVRVALGRAVGDPRLSLALWSAELGRFVAADGSQAVEDPTRLAITATDAAGSPVARVGVDPRLEESRDLVDAVVRAAGVALENARLQAEVAARRREVEDSAEQLLRARDETRTLSRLVPGGLAERLRADPDALTQPEQLTVTVLMSDVRGYSAIAETTPPDVLAGQVDAHRKAMNAVVLAEGGTVLQYVGDAVMAVFGAPLPLAAHEERALRAAAGMHRAQRRLDVEWAAHGLPSFGLGIGVCTGEVAAGLLGSAERVEYTVVGDTVNLAARLTDLARPAGVTVAAATTVTGASGGWQAEALPPTGVKGRAAPVAAYRVLESVERTAAG